MRHRRWISAQELDRWADTNDAKARLPELIRRLVHATVEPSDLELIDFPAGEETHRPGYDGVTQTTRGNAWVPQGICFWEMGANLNVKGKLDDDYDKRIERRGQGDFTNTSYRAVTPRDYQNKVTWVDDKTALGHWRDVRVYDSSDLEQWLDATPGVALWLARYASRAPEGILDLCTHWENLRGSLRRPLPPTLLLISREGVINRFKTWLNDGPTILSVLGHSPQEVVDVFAAWVESLDAAEAAPIASRAIIVERPEAWRDLADSEQRLILIAGAGLELKEELLTEAQRKGHHVLLPIPRVHGQTDNPLSLERMNRGVLEKQLIENGLNEQEAHLLAQHSDGSFTVLKRQFSAVPLVSVPAWGSESNASELAPLLLAGSWQDKNPADQTAVARLTSAIYADARKCAQRWHSQPDAPIRWNSGVWEFVSPIDAWTFLGPTLDPDCLDAFEEVARTVLGEDDPRLDLPAEERWQASIQGKKLLHSTELRQGVAQTLALLATRKDGGRLTDLIPLQTRVNRVVRQILPADGSWRRYASLGGLLPILAEAAPEEVLDSVEAGLRGPTPELPKLFGQERSGFTGRAEHTGLLWALERLAWPPHLVTRVSLALAKLAEHDPGGQWGNRPAGSLSRIFFSWMPHTTASLDERLELLGLLLRRHPKVGWKLLLSLLPQHHESIMMDRVPEWRFWAEDWQRYVINSDYERTIREFVRLAVSAAEETPARWPEVIEKLMGFRGDAIEHALDGLGRCAGTGSIDLETRRQIWVALRELAQQHRYFTDAEWRWPEELIARVEGLRDAFQPDDAVEQASPWFEQGFGMVGDQSLPYEEQEKIREARRLEAIEAILRGDGFDGVLRLVRRVQDTWAVGFLLARLTGAEHDGRVLPALLCDGEKAVATMAGAYATARFHDSGMNWVRALPLSTWEAEQAGALIACLPFDPSTWDYAQALGASIERIYWQRTGCYGPNLSEAAVVRAVRQFLAVGRHSSGLQLMVLTGNEAGALSPILLLDLVEEIFATPSQEPNRPLDPYNLQMLLKRMQGSSEVDEVRLARLEWLLLPGLDQHTLLPATLQKVLARDPSFFVEMLSVLYRPRHREDEGQSPNEPDKSKADMATRVWRLLRDWKRVPGTREDGTVDPDALRAWLRDARERARASDRLEVADITIGEMFARAPGETDGSWPCIAVREALEECDSTKLENGFSIGICNLRGAHFRALDEGGKQERELAERYEGYAKASRGRWPRTEAVLLQVAGDYRAQAQREDASAERG